jgi:hypothetical protein
MIRQSGSRCRGIKGKGLPPELEKPRVGILNMNTMGLRSEEPNNQSLYSFAEIDRKKSVSHWSTFTYMCAHSTWIAEQALR